MKLRKVEHFCLTVRLTFDGHPSAYNAHLVLTFFVRPFGTKFTRASQREMSDMSWKQMITIPLLLMQRGFRSSRPVGRVGFEIAEPARDTNNLQDYHNSLLKLPDELLLVIANFLDQEFQVLLSLSCKRLRVPLDSCLDL
jgi:hypothetical protein